MVVGRLWELPCNGYWVLHLDERFLEVCCTTVDIYLARVHCTLKNLSLNVMFCTRRKKKNIHILLLFIYVNDSYEKKPRVLSHHSSFPGLWKAFCILFSDDLSDLPSTPETHSLETLEMISINTMPPFAKYLMFLQHRLHCPSSLLQAFTDPWLAVTLSHTTLVLITGNFNISKDGPNSPLSSHFLFIYSSELTFHPLTQSFPRVCVRFLSCAWLFASL